MTYNSYVQYVSVKRKILEYIGTGEIFDIDTNNPIILAEFSDIKTLKALLKSKMVIDSEAWRELERNVRGNPTISTQAKNLLKQWMNKIKKKYPEKIAHAPGAHKMVMIVRPLVDVLPRKIAQDAIFSQGGFLETIYEEYNSFLYGRVTRDQLEEWLEKQIKELQSDMVTSWKAKCKALGISMVQVLKFQHLFARDLIRILNTFEKQFWNFLGTMGRRHDSAESAIEGQRWKEYEGDLQIVARALTRGQTKVASNDSDVIWLMRLYQMRAA